MGKIQVLSHMPMSGAKSENYASAIQRLTDSKTLEKANARQSPYARSLPPSDARDIGPQQLDSKNSHRLQEIIMGIIIWYNKCQEPWVCAILDEGGLWHHRRGITRRETSVTMGKPVDH